MRNISWCIATWDVSWLGRWLLTGGLILISCICNYNYPRHKQLVSKMPESDCGTQANFDTTLYQSRKIIHVPMYFYVMSSHIISQKRKKSGHRKVFKSPKTFHAMYLLFITLTPHLVLGAIFSLTLISHRRPQKDNHLAKGRGARTPGLG